MYQTCFLDTLTRIVTKNEFGIIIEKSLEETRKKSENYIKSMRKK